MTLRFLLSGTSPGVGKTMIGCALAFAFKVRGLRAGVMKPIETGCVERDGELAAADAESLIAAASCELPPRLVCQYRYRARLAPLLAAASDNAPPPEFGVIEKAGREVIARSDAVLVEDSGGLAIAIDAGHDFADLARTLGLGAILVVANNGRYVDEAASALGYASTRGVPIRGFIMNALDPETSATVLRDAEALARVTRVRCLGTVRFKEPLALGIVEQLFGSA